MIVSADSIQRAGEILKEIEALQAELAELFGNKTGATGLTAPKRRGRPPGAAGKRGKMSAEGRARIAAAAKARWAKFHAEQAKAAKKGN
jgi:hypothetical protein